MTESTRDRAVAALYGLAIGDALGMPTQMLSPDEIAARFGRLDGFRAADPAHPIAAGMPAGAVTDDTEQALLLADALIEGDGQVDAERFARSLIAWEEDMRSRGSLDLLGPSTKAAVEAILSGTPVEEAGREGATNGAAMRVTPVGIVAPSNDLGGLVDRVVQASAVTHNTTIAIAGAAAVAAAVSAGIDGAGVSLAVRTGIAAADLGGERGHWAAGGEVARRIEWAISLAEPGDPENSVRRIRSLIGTSLATQESVPAAFGIIATFPDDPWSACLAAAGLGGDSDTIGAMVGAILGACLGTAGFPAEALATIRDVNGLELETIADRLLSLRR